MIHHDDYNDFFITLVRRAIRNFLFLRNSAQLRPKPSNVHLWAKSGSPGLPNDDIANPDWQRRHRTGLRLQHQQLSQAEHLLKVGADHLQGLRARAVHH